MANPKVVIIGAGFGGLFAARELANKPVDVLVVDRNNYHTFTPLLYQVATCALDPSEIAPTIRGIFHDRKNVRFLLGEVTAINSEAQTVTLHHEGESRDELYDYLILATGSIPTYFGNEEFRQHSFELRTLEDAVRLRNHILRQLERASWLGECDERQALTSIVVVGGGPTGLETAGAIYELYNHVIEKEYPECEGMRTEVMLVEALPKVLPAYPDKLRDSARKQLESLGVKVMLDSPVAEVTADHIGLEDGTVIPTYTTVWTAGIKASPVAEMLGVELRKNGAVPIEETMLVKGKQNIYAVGDMTYLPQKKDEGYPGLIPVAKQQGILAAKNILRNIRGEQQQKFKYIDRGIMATIGRRRAVAHIYNKIPLSGYIAWLSWLGLHLVTLLGFRNRLQVFVNWLWNYITYDRSVRIILDPAPAHEVPLNKIVEKTGEIA